MAKPQASSNRSSEATTAKAAARRTTSRPAKPTTETGGDPLAAQAADTQKLVESMPYNTTKAYEFGRDNAVYPSEGQTAELPSNEVGASTLTEANPSAKTGQPPGPGAQRTSGELDRVRADASGQRLTTNQGVPVADNQNSLKAGLRGPALLEDFILREKITHFDHERASCSTRFGGAWVLRGL
jgi:catalase